MRSEPEIRAFVEDLRDCPMLNEEPDFELLEATPIARLALAAMVAGIQAILGPPGEYDTLGAFARKWAGVDLDNGDSIDDTEGS